MAAPIAGASDSERIVVTNARLVGRDAAAQDIAVNVIVNEPSQTWAPRWGSPAPASVCA
jgi:hypothetical protein